MSAPIPNNEAARLAALRRYQLLDTAPEQSFDDFSRLASFVCGTPIALVSLVDENRQWFKSKLGLEISETPRDDSFCAHAVAMEKTLVVENALQDPRFVDNPLVTSDINLRFYAGAPLIDRDGFGLGALCVIDRKPRVLSDDQRSALEMLARQVTTLCEYRRVSAELNHSLEEIKTLQGLLPICMHCKKIRSDDGFWKSVEDYVCLHSEAEFSHGICSDCIKLHYGELYDELVATGKIEPA